MALIKKKRQFMKSIQSILYFLIFIINITIINAQSTNIYLILDRENYGTGEVAHGVLVIDGVKIHNKALHIVKKSEMHRQEIWSTTHHQKFTIIKA